MEKSLDFPGPELPQVNVDNIEDEDLLRQMWTEADEGEVKKQIRLRMYKLREQRLKEFYNREGILENIFKTTESNVGIDESQVLPEDVPPPCKINGTNRSTSPDRSTLKSPKRQSRPMTADTERKNATAQSNHPSPKRKLIMTKPASIQINSVKIQDNSKSAKILDKSKPTKLQDNSKSIKTLDNSTPTRTRYNSKSTKIQENLKPIKIEIISKSKAEIEEKPKSLGLIPPLPPPKPTKAPPAELHNGKTRRTVSTIDVANSTFSKSEAFKLDAQSPISLPRTLEVDNKKSLPRFMTPTQSRLHATDPNPNIKSKKTSNRSPQLSKNSAPLPSSASFSNKSKGRVRSEPEKKEKAEGTKSRTSILPLHSQSRARKVKDPTTPVVIAPTSNSSQKIESGIQHKIAKTLNHGSSSNEQLDIITLELDSYLKELSDNETKVDHNEIGEQKVELPIKKQTMGNNKSTLKGRVGPGRKQDVQKTGEEPIVTRSEFKYHFNEKGLPCDDDKDVKNAEQDQEFKLPQLPKTPLLKNPGDTASGIPKAANSTRRESAPLHHRRPSSSTSEDGVLEVSTWKLIRDGRIDSPGVVRNMKTLFERKAVDDVTHNPFSRPQTYTIKKKVQTNTAKFETKTKKEGIGEMRSIDHPALVEKEESVLEFLPKRRNVPGPFCSTGISELPQFPRPKQGSQKSTATAKTDDTFSIAAMVDELPKPKAFEPSGPSIETKNTITSTTKQARSPSQATADSSMELVPDGSPERAGRRHNSPKQHRLKESSVPVPLRKIGKDVKTPGTSKTSTKTPVEQHETQASTVEDFLGLSEVPSRPPTLYAAKQPQVDLGKPSPNKEFIVNHVELSSQPLTGVGNSLSSNYQMGACAYGGKPTDYTGKSYLGFAKREYTDCLKVHDQKEISTLTDANQNLVEEADGSVDLLSLSLDDSMGEDQISLEDLIEESEDVIELAEAGNGTEFSNPGVISDNKLKKNTDGSSDTQGQVV